MALTTIRGTLLPLLQKVTQLFDPQRGYITRYEYRGVSLAQMQGLQQDYVRQGISCSLEFSAGIATLEAEDSTQQYTLDNWQLEGDEINVDGLSHPTVQAIINSSSDPQTLMAVLRSGLQNDTPPDQISDPSFDSLTDAQAAIVGRFYSLQQRGSTEFQNDFDGSGYVLKHTTNVSNRWLVNVADFNVGSIYSTSALLTEIQSSALWILPCPPRLAYKINNIPVATPQPFYQWGWKKSRSTETTAANNRVDIVQKYTLALWSTDYYPNLV